MRATPEECREYARLKRLAFPEIYRGNKKHIENSSRWNRANKHRHNMSCRRYYWKHHDRLLLRGRRNYNKFFRDNPTKIAEHNHKRRDKISINPEDCIKKILLLS